MYLSRIQLSVSKRRTMKALADPKIFHGALESCFFDRESTAGSRPRIVWRTDGLNRNFNILIVSERETDFSSFCEKFSPSENSWETKDYEPFLEHIKNGNVWRFRLTANPVFRTPVKDSRDSRGRIIAHGTAAHQKEWLEKKSSEYGFQPATDGFDVIGNKWFRFRKAGKDTVTLLSVTYEGLLTVTDADLFRETLRTGMGRGKAWGMGLLTVVRA